jgi:hypothetical protein
MRSKQSFSVLPGAYAICHMPANAPLPTWAREAFTSVTRTAEELSIVCEERRLPPDLGGVELRVERGWALLKLHGPFPLDAIGILASVATPLAEAGISLLALGTFNTDYLLVKRDHLERAVAALVEAGHTLVDG